MNVTSILTSALLSTSFALDPGFDIKAVANESVQLPSHSWEYGAASMALLELYNPELTVFAAAPFPVPTVAPETVFAMTKGLDWIVLGEGVNGLSDGDGATGDPASLGVIAWLIGKTRSEYADASTGEVVYLTEEAPRWTNGSGAGAISQRADVAELWADFMYMAPPFLAYYAADTSNDTLLYESYKQSEYYRAVLQDTAIADQSFNGVWHHIIGPQSQDLGLWSTGNGWAAGGMTRILATIMHAPMAALSDWRETAISDLTAWIKEIVDGVMGSVLEDGMVHNYMDIDGSIEEGPMIANVIYRMAVLQPQAFGSKYVQVDSAGNPHVTAEGIITPTVNPLNWFDLAPFTAGSPEGNAFAVMIETSFLRA
ncbi:hypothetical protein BDZ89DRAFT_1089091 [Hymenopellis radicata]|nr:hypothetical protein BDZ89DRAFT_1089091 [Hymenopellis radicata]